MGLFKRRATVNQALQPDRDRAAFDAAIAMAQRHPPGTQGDVTDPHSVARIADWMRERFAAGDYQSVWQRRLDLGYGLSQDGVAPEVWYSVNTLPALAALRLGLRDHPFVATCGGLADSVYWGIKHRDEAMRQSKREVDAAFGG